MKSPLRVVRRRPVLEPNRVHVPGTAVQARVPEVSSLSARIRELKTELRVLEAQQRHELVIAISGLIGTGVQFSACDLFEDPLVAPALRMTFREMGIQSPKQLGKRLRRFWLDAAGTHPVVGVTRLGRDEHGALWVCG